MDFFSGWLEVFSGLLELLLSLYQPLDNIMAASADKHHIFALRDDDNLVVNILEEYK